MYNIERLIRGYKYLNDTLSYKEYMEYLIKTYNGVLRPDGLYDFPGYVNISGQGLNIVPTIFGVVQWDFNCSYNQLKSLEGSPQGIDRNFNCSNNQLESLLGCPQSVGWNFYCSDNKLKSLEGCPKYVGGNFYCRDNLVQFTEEEVRLRCNVGGDVHV